jgi:integrase
MIVPFAAGAAPDHAPGVDPVHGGAREHAGAADGRAGPGTLFVAGELGMKVKIGCHTFRATGVTAYLEAGGTLENAQAMAAHESPRTKLYDRTKERLTQDEVERIML